MSNASARRIVFSLLAADVTCIAGRKRERRRTDRLRCVPLVAAHYTEYGHTLSTSFVVRRPTDMWCTCDVIPSRKVATEYARERKCNSKQLTKETADLNDIDILKSARLPYTTSFRPTRPLLL